MADDGTAPPDDSNKAKAAAFAERMGQSASGADDDAKADAKDENEGLTKAQIAAKERRAARETARQTRASKRPVKEEDKEPEPVTVGPWSENDCGGAIPHFGLADAERLYVFEDDTARAAGEAADDARRYLDALPKPEPEPCASYVGFFGDDGTDAFVEAAALDDLSRMHKCIRPQAQWGKRTPPWDAATGTFVYERPELHTTNHETVPELIENGDVELLNALLDCGHLPEGLDRPDPEFGLTAAYLAVTYDQPAVLDVLAARGCDLAKMCDGEGDDAYATPAFYAAYHGKVRCLEALVRLGVDATEPCTKHGEAPAAFYAKHGAVVAGQLAFAATFRHRMATRLTRYLLMAPRRRSYRVTVRYCALIQRVFRGFAGRRNAYQLATALLEDQRAAEAAAQAALAHLAELEAAKEPEEVLTMAEAVAREEEAEMRAALAAANDGRAEWEEFFDEASGLPYYVHYQTGESVWEKPDTA